MKKLILFAVIMFAARLAWAQWEPDVRLTNDPAGSFTTFNFGHCVAATGDTVHIVWYDKRDGTDEVYYKHSTDGGLSWGDDTRLTYNPATLYFSYPEIAVSGSIVHVFWTDGRDGNPEVYYKRSDNGGSTWGEDTRLTNVSGYSWVTCAAVSGLNIHVVWYDNRDGNWRIYYKHSTDGGLNWGPDTMLTANTTYAIYPSVSVSGPIVHVAWYDNRDGNKEIYYNRSADGGISWGEEKRLTNDPGASNCPSITVSGSDIQVAWYDNRDGNYEIYYKSSADGGTSWGNDTRLTEFSGDSKYPNISVSGSAVHIVWQDNRDGNDEIYYKRSDDEGLSWGEDTRLTNSSGDSGSPGIAVSGPVVHVVWTDLRDGNEEIYYKRNPSGGFAVGTDHERAGNSDFQMNIYPNPASKLLNITFNSTSPESIASKIIDLSGRSFGIYTFNSVTGRDQFLIDLNDFQNGLYFIEFTTGNQRCFRKFVISK